MFRRVCQLTPQQLKQQVENTKALLDAIANYQSILPSRDVVPSETAPPMNWTLPQTPRPYSEVLKEIQEKVLPNNINRLHPMFFGYFPVTASWSAIQGSILAKALCTSSFTKQLSPISYEAEMLVSDWLAEMLDLPKFFYNQFGPGGGVTYSTSSEATLTAMSCARLEKPNNPVVYTSDHAHFSIDKSARVLGLPLRTIPCYYNESIQNYSIDIQKLKDEIAKDKKAGLTPAMVVGCIGGTNVCSMDDNTALGQICREEDMWFHIDAAYAGNFGILPEKRYVLRGVEYCTTFSINSNKMLMTGIGSSHMWVSDKKYLIKNLSQDSNYLPGGHDVDLKNWQIPLGRECKALNSWFVIQEYGVEGIRKHLRNYIEAAKVAEDIITADDRLEMVVRRDLSLLIFRVKGENANTDRVIKKLAKNKKIFMLGSNLNGKSIIRFTPGSYVDGHTNIHEAFRILKSYLD